METENSVTPAPSMKPNPTATGVVTQTFAARDRYELMISDNLLTAVRAQSCLVQPQVGDIVACMQADAGMSYIIAVLERPGGRPLTLTLPPGSLIHCEDGTLELRADALSLRARALSVEGEQAHLSFDQMVGVGQRASWSFGAVKFTAELLEVFAERVLQFSRWSQRMVDGPDQVRARQIDYRAEQTLQLQAQTLIANADKLLKADGEQIHLG
ncbi:DUF3540 domain-containing protein [Ottowia caeni]|uniref:DUF3540 domain-containing protein n=1 Tax=Ottowia caeni TaxID=2870339 RepID=UPI001E3D480E|nr:DUF3540 domain-containing protein [Ottowia caeni]